MLKKQRRRSPDVLVEEDETDHIEQPSVRQPTLWLFLSVPMVAIALCGSREPWAIGLLATLIGACAVVTPTRQRVPAVMWLGALGAILWSATAFLPAAWFSTPTWYLDLARDFGIVTSRTLSPQPWVSLESWLMLCMGAVWFIACRARGFSSREQRTAIQTVTWFISLVAVTAFVVRHWRLQIPLWLSQWPHTPYDFGPFPNRNNFSGLLAIGGLLGFASAYDAMKRKQRRWLLLALGVLPIYAALLSNTSRLGVILFFVGVGVWMLTSAFGRTATHRIVVTLSMMLILAAGLILFGQPLLGKFLGADGTIVASLAHDARWTIFADTVALIAESPILGTALGNFEPVFALARTTDYNYWGAYSRPAHPESDWLWFAAETGLPGLMLALTACAALVGTFWLWRGQSKHGRRARRLCNAAGVGFLMVALQGLLDTPLHTPGMAAFAALLAALAGRPCLDAEVVPESLFSMRRIVGIALVGFGLCGLLSATQSSLLTGAAKIRSLSREAAELSRKGDDAGALVKWNAAAKVSPLQWSVYYERACVKLRLGFSSQDAFQDFSLARRLEPRNALVCWNEFHYWMGYDPVYGMSAARDALLREPQRRVEFFANFFGTAQAHPELRAQLREMALQDPKMLLVYLGSVTGGEFRSGLDHLLELHPSLSTFTAQEQRQLFLLWAERGDATRLMEAMEQNVEWLSQGWSVMATMKAKRGDFRGAYELAIKYVTPQLQTATARKGSLAELNRAFLYNPTDIARGLELYEAQKAQALNDAALATLEQISTLPTPPAKVHYERAVILARKGDYSKAWSSLQEYMSRVSAP